MDESWQISWPSYRADTYFVRLGHHYRIHTEGALVYLVSDSAVRCDMIDYEEVVEAIWRYDIPRIDIDEDVTTLYANGKAFAQVIRRPIAIGMSFAENIGKEKQRIIRYTGWFLLLIYMVFG